MKNTRLLRSTLAAAAAAAALLMNAAQAATATNTLQVNATVISACVMSGSTLSFGGNLDPTAAVMPVDASTTMTVQCTLTTPYSVALSAGANAGGASNFSARAIKNGTHTLGYQLYLDSTRTTVWGDGTSGSSTLPGTGTGSNQTLTVYGRLPSLSGAVPGSYTDTVTVTVTY